MKKSTTVLAISILVLSLASQFSWCAEAAEGSAGISTEPDLQVQEQVHGQFCCLFSLFIGAWIVAMHDWANYSPDFTE
jgi:hypothetical protein